MASPESSNLILAEQHLRSGRAADCQSLCQSILAAEPNNAEAHRLLATSYYLQQNFTACGDAMQRAIELAPENGEYHDNLASLRLSQERWAEAEAAARQATARIKHPGAWFRLGESLRNQQKFAEAETAYRHSIEMQPGTWQTWFNLGLTLSSLGKFTEAEAAYRRVIAAEPNMAHAWTNLGNALLGQNRGPEAVEAYQKGVALGPEVAQTHYNLAHALGLQGRLVEAMREYGQTLQFDPNSAEAHTNLGTLLVEVGDIPQAEEHFKQALAVRPSHVGAHTNLLLTAQYHSDVTLEHLAALHSDWNRKFAEPLKATWRPHDNSRDPERPLTLGFVSGDFGLHPLGHFFAKALDGIDREQFRTVCYSNRQVTDWMTERIRAAAGQWREVSSSSDEALAEMIRRDGIDILFDLSGHTHGNRLLAFARKPAPVQVTWMGYIGTTGMPAMDCLLTDEVLVPRESERFYAERIVRLPGGTAPCEPPAGAPEVSPLPALTAGKVMLGSFNNPAKIRPIVIETWAEILRRLPNASLALKHRAWQEPAVCVHYAEMFHAAGIDSGRIEFRTWSPLVDMLSEYRTIDLALDPFPYTGGSTSWLSMWMGVPIITWPGETMASRQTLDLASRVGLEDFVATSHEDYMARAVRWANDLDKLAEVRANLRPRLAASSLCDFEGFRREFSTAIRGTWRDFCPKQKAPGQAKAVEDHLL